MGTLDKVGRRFVGPMILAGTVGWAFWEWFVEGDVKKGLTGLLIGVVVVAVIELTWRRAGNFDPSSSYRVEDD